MRGATISAIEVIAGAKSDYLFRFDAGSRPGTGNSAEATDNYAIYNCSWKWLSGRSQS